MALPHPRHACQTQRRTAAGCTPSTRATSPTGRPAPTSPTAWTRTAVGSVYRGPATLHAARPAGLAWPVRLGCRRTPAPARPRLRAGAGRPCRARRDRPRPSWHRRSLPDGPADSGGSRGPGRASGRVGGKPRQHRSDRLGLLLRKPAAGLTAQQLHLVGEPWRPWSWPPTPAATLAVGLAAGGEGPGLRWCMHGSLLPTADRAAVRVPGLSSMAGGWWGVSHPIPGRASITPIRAFTHPRAPKPSTSVQHRRQGSAQDCRAWSI